MYRSTSSSPANDIDVAALWHAIWGRKLLIAATVLVVGFAAYTILSLLTPQYSSEARILIENDESAFTRPTNGQANQVPIDPEAVASQVQVLLSRDLALEVIKALDLAKKPEFNPALRALSPFKGLLARVGLAKKKPPEDNLETVLDAFEEQLTISQIHKSRVIAVRVTSSNKTLSAEVANRLAESYLSWQQRERMSQTKDATIWLRDQIGLLRNKVDESEAAVARFRGTTGIVSGENDVALSSQELSELNSQLILAKAQRSEAEARAALITRMLREKGEVDASPDVLKSELIRNLLEQRVTVQRSLAEMSATLLPSHPRMRQLRSELADLRSQTRKEARKIVRSLESEAQIAGAREASLTASLNQLKSDKTSVSESEIRLRGLEREAKVNRDLLESYLTRYSDASARNDFLAVPAYASIISRAGVARSPSFPKKKMLTSLAMAATAFLLIAFLLTRELIVDQAAAVTRPERVASPDFLAVRESLRAGRASDAEPIYAPPPSRPDVAATVQDVTDLVRARGPGRALIVPKRRAVDATDEAVSIARALARTGEHVVLVDLPETSDELSKTFGFAGAQGIGELVAGVAGFEDVVRKDPNGPAHVIVRGHPRLNPAHKGEDEAFTQVLAALDQTYDHVLLHANGSAAQNLLARFADDLESVVLVGEADGAAPDGAWSEFERHVSQHGLDDKVIRFERPVRPQGVLARLPRVGRPAAV